MLGNIFFSSNFQVFTRQNEIKTPDWNPVVDEEGHKSMIGIIYEYDCCY